ncbi:MAG: fumarylacetoacetate hydrolase family protein [Dehalococcoidia bacterium]|nr:fumarylacetoacetate hydrolase family protein [Dehalococcoidia bacterium]
MKLVTFEVGSNIGALLRVGAVVDDVIVDLQIAFKLYLREALGVARAAELAGAIIPGGMLAFIENGPVALEAAGQALDHLGAAGTPMVVERERAAYRVSEVRLRAPIPRPVSLRDTLNFEVHLKNAMKALNRDIPKLWYELPTFYRTTHTNVAGPEDPIMWPSFTEQLDYELEFACCIGKEGKSIPRDKASDYIFGYTIFNDISARDILAKELGLGVGPAKGKNFANANIMGPCLVTADEIDADNVRMVARINGEVWSEGNSKDMHFKFSELIEYLTMDEPIYPGEFIASGTVGFGCCLELGKWIKPGDVVELEVEGIGVLRNTVMDKA